MAYNNNRLVWLGLIVGLILGIVICSMVTITQSKNIRARIGVGTSKIC